MTTQSKASLLAAALLSVWAAHLPAQAPPAAPDSTVGDTVVQAATGPLTPDTVLTPPDGPRLVVLGTPGSGVAALRLHVPLVEGPAEAGAGSLIRELALDRMRGLARPVGARVSVTRTPWGLSYAAEGAAADFEFLAYLLREAAGPPELEDVPFTRAHQRLAARVARDAETPAGRLSATLRRSLAPATPPVEGTAATMDALGPGRVLEVWRRSHQSSRMTLVVSAGVLPEVVLAATRGMGADERVDAAPLDAPEPPGGTDGETQSLRRWYGRAWSAGTPGDPRGPVAALLVSRVLGEAGGDFETTLQLRALPDRWALLVLGAAYRAQVPAMQAAVDGALTAARQSLTPEGAADAAARVRRDLLYRARTPLGLVEVVGRALEHAGDPDAAARYLEALDTVDAEAMDRFLEALQAGPRLASEVRP